MKRIWSAAVVAGVLAAGCLTAGTVLANDGGSSSDERALAPTRGAPSRSIERRIDRLLARMTTEEKLQQVQLLSDGQITDADAAAGVGGVFSLTDPAKIDHFQRIAMTRSRLKIPILFAYDTIHGYRTIFPVPLGAASSFDPEVARADARIGARESTTVGIKQIYSPMVDVSHEPRWGRIVEGNGEDPYLGSVFAAARVKGAQGDDYSKPDRAITSVKHFVAYGDPEGGRDYGTTDLSEQLLRNLYLPPFKAAVEAGADTVMCSFNALNGVPGCANHYTETEILKKEWGFDGFIESDYTAVTETINHGTAADDADAGAQALMAGTDSEMVSTTIRDHGEELLADGRISERRLDDAVRRILRVKFRAGLFERPYVDQAKAVDPASFLTAADRRAARTAAARSMVLLQNEGQTLPLDPTKDTAVIGPLADSQHDMLGTWSGKGEDADAVSVLTGITDGSSGTTTYAQGCALSNDEPPAYDPADDCPTDAGFAAAVAAASAADQVVLAVGETKEMSGEAATRSTLDLPGRQQELIDAIAATGKPFVVVLFNGRPLTLTDVVDSAPAVLEAWFPGVEAGHAVADVVFGKVNPGGKLPVTFPQRLGQVPIYYNHEPTGRPCDVTQKYNSRYRDLRSCDPLFAFGHGLSYTTFDVTDLRLSRSTVSRKGRVVASMKVTNTGDVAGDEVAQLYLRDPVASISQPVRRLRGFERVTLRPGASTTVRFTLDASDFGFYDNRGKFVVEPGEIQVFAGSDSTARLTRSFRVTR
ncbi:beta-glucosidase BglX [Nocardioides lianchengensis]|uniref:Exo-alpha-(1->6)-L-arabinopyranosidase n=1 Tax=Nocardioides lianchengensis TaxID=1045774 RepID=A0A1G6N7T3_9ACTN|nr:beta-glucosidase BglX [Nocardioides lianchengensis]NYG10668.1 beta-glucosidase [Nocardioides lianchengensis]SDC63205.1 beta-glucosidase [Nocardioides lianchengensis]